MGLAITSGNTSTVYVDPKKEGHTIAVTGAGTASVVPYVGDMTVGNDTFNVSDVVTYIAFGVNRFDVTASGGDIEVVVQ